MTTATVIFDVDGPLLELTRAEEDLFFLPLKALFGLTNFCRDWNRYAIRNDIEIYREILHNHLGRAPNLDEIRAVTDAYVTALETGYTSGALQVAPIPGARRLLQKLSRIPDLTLGIATANLQAAAKVRLQRAHLWQFVKDHPGAAEAGGAKSNILANVLAGIDVAPKRTIFIGDNLNDLEAASATGVHFIGFHTSEEQQQRLIDAGAQHVCGDHETTWILIQDFWRQD